MHAGRKVGVVAATVVVLGEGSPPVAPYLPDLPLVHAADRLDLAEILSLAEGDVVLVDAQLGCSGSFPIDDVCQPGASRVLVADGGTAPVRVAGGLVVSAGTSTAPLADHQGLAAGCLQVVQQDRQTLDQVVQDLDDGPTGRLWERILSGLVMAAVPVKPVLAAPFVVGEGPVVVAADPTGMQARRCARGGDGWLSELTVRRMSRVVTPVAVRLGLAPNTVTLISLVAGAAAVAFALPGTRWGYLLTALFMVVSLVLDCVDGEVARWTHRYSTSGAWLDAVGDRVKEYSIWFAVGWAVGQHGLLAADRHHLGAVHGQALPRLRVVVAVPALAARPGAAEPGPRPLAARRRRPAERATAFVATDLRNADRRALVVGRRPAADRRPVGDVHGAGNPRGGFAGLHGADPHSLESSRDRSRDGGPTAGHHRPGTAPAGVAHLSWMGCRRSPRDCLSCASQQAPLTGHGR